MPREISEPVAVVCAPNGEPRSFVWQRFEYEVLGVPVQFFRRRPWWRPLGDSAQAGDLERIDRAWWRVEATPTGRAEDARSYDLLSGPDDEGWVLALEWE